MFYINKNLKTELAFSHYDMDKLSSDEEILKKLREKIEGRCHPEYGYLIQVPLLPSRSQKIRTSISACLVSRLITALWWSPSPP